MSEKRIAVLDAGELLEFSWASLYAYCGPSQIIASALIFRLFERAFHDLSPASPPDRKDFQFLSGFPGRGIAECVELVMRLRTLQPERYAVNTGAAPAEAPHHVSGAMYFEVQIKDKRKGYWPPNEVFDDVFRKNVGLYQGGGGSPEEQTLYFAYKKRVAQLILAAPSEGFFSFREAAALPLEGCQAIKL